MQHQYTILHLDDNPVFLNITKALFQNQEDINYESVFTAQDAFSYLEKNEPDLIFVDLMLDDKDPETGICFIEKVNQRFPKARMLVITGHQNNLSNRVSPFIIDYIQKGYDPGPFTQKILSHLKKK